MGFLKRLFNKQKSNPNTPTLTVSHNGDRYWQLPNGQLHRDDGPAVEWANGAKQWYLCGQHLTEAEFNARHEEQQAAHQTAALQADLATLTTGLDKPLPVASGKLKLRAPSPRS